jgi:regulatory protein
VRLRRRGAPADVADDVVADLTARGDLDDEAFARDWVATRAPRGYGPARLRAELRTRGVDASLVEAALAEAARAGASEDGELERARAVARRRWPSLQRGDRARAAARLRDHLRRRGYSAAVVARVVRECVGLRLED